MTVRYIGNISGGFMRSRVVLLTFAFALLLAVLGCNKSASDNNNPSDTNATTDNAATPSQDAKEHKEHREAKRRQPLIVPAGSTITVSLGSALGSKLSQAGQTFTGSVAKDVVVENKVAIPQGANVAGTVVDAKALGKFKGGAVLQLRLDSITVNGSDRPVTADAQTFSEKGKGKRTAIITGGGAALGGIIGGLAGGGKGAAIGALAGGGAGAGGSALTGNKEIVLPAESAVSFQLSQPFEVN
jgi:hypothetical protein